MSVMDVDDATYKLHQVESRAVMQLLDDLATLDIPWTNPEFIFYPDPYSKERFIHIGTPEWVKRPDSLFQCNGDTLCGAGESRNKPNGIGYYRRDVQRPADYEPQRYTAPPPGIRLCKQCVEHLTREFLPFVTEEEDQ